MFPRQEWWQNPEEVDLVQFMGKDNVPFHTIIFPATLIGTREKWTRMKNISVTEYLNYEHSKFSKTNCTGVFGNDAKETGIPVEVHPSVPCLGNQPDVAGMPFHPSSVSLGGCHADSCCPLQDNLVAC